MHPFPDEDSDDDLFISRRPWDTTIPVRERSSTMDDVVPGRMARLATISAASNADAATVPGPIALTRSVSQETRDRLEAAKQAYKAEKDKYRREREERRRDRERKLSDAAYVSDPSSLKRRASDNESDNDSRTLADVTVETAASGKRDRDGGVSASATAGPSSRTADAPVANGEPVTIVSNARGPYPQLEMVNVTPPRRHHTVTGATRSRRSPGEMPGSSRIYTSFYSPSTSAAIRAGNSVRSRLADVRILSSFIVLITDTDYFVRQMGFTSSTYPDLQSRVNQRVSVAMTDNDITQEAEDSIVSDVVDELLTLNIDKELPPKPASSAVNSTPGEWRN